MNGCILTRLYSGHMLWFVYDISENACKIHLLYPGGRLNKKDSLTRYGDSHVKDKTS